MSVYFVNGFHSITGIHSDYWGEWVRLDTAFQTNGVLALTAAIHKRPLIRYRQHMQGIGFTRNIGPKERIESLDRLVEYANRKHVVSSRFSLEDWRRTYNTAHFLIYGTDHLDYGRYGYVDDILR